MSVEHIWPCTVFDVIFFLSVNPLKNVDILDTYHNILNQLDQNLWALAVVAQCVFSACNKRSLGTSIHLRSEPYYF